MVYQSPTGARDLLPLGVAQKRWIEKRIQAVLHRWGYHRIITSTIERMDTLMAGGAVQPAAVIQLQGLEGEWLGLRPELTASIARAVGTRMTNSTFPQRLYYSANVFRNSDRNSHTDQYEFFQTGVELLGSAGTLADAEVIHLVTDCLWGLGLKNWSLILGEASLTRSLLLPFPPAVREQVQEAIAQLDRVGLETMQLAPDLLERALFLLDLRGRPADVLQRVAQLDLTAEQQAAVHRLKSLVELLDDCALAADPDTPCIPNCVLDLSLVQTFDYYTGIIFEVVTPTLGGQRVLGQGGRYDQLLNLYAPQAPDLPGVGFCLNLEDLHQTLLPTGCLPSHTPPSDCLVVATSPAAHKAAFQYAQSQRRSPESRRIEVALDESPDPDQVRAYARDRQIAQIAWIDGDGDLTVEQP